ncbi:hypothetical protein CMUS01_02738 [Colletotrichum musicola]|uniref:Uncharacterized protein n=1 Tax=Colletotrichum musicola TaxID=2175873 RepID=A0A8H6NUJ3_9PEZI|nr:hypothetical protein CMUS01_02738 [Colletotrichum musicola]
MRPTTIDLSWDSTRLEQLRSSKSTTYTTFENDLIDSMMRAAWLGHECEPRRDQQDPGKKAAQAQHLAVLDDYDDTIRVLPRCASADELSGARGLASKCEWPQKGGV